MSKLVYDFSEGNKDLKDLLGGKGANLAEMTNLGLPVPPGFIISTDACRHYLRHGDVPTGLSDETSEHLARLEEAMGRRLGDPADHAVADAVEHELDRDRDGHRGPQPADEGDGRLGARRGSKREEEVRRVHDQPLDAG